MCLRAAPRTRVRWTPRSAATATSLAATPPTAAGSSLATSSCTQLGRFICYALKVPELFSTSIHGCHAHTHRVLGAEVFVVSYGMSCIYWFAWFHLETSDVCLSARFRPTTYMYAYAYCHVCICILSCMHMHT